jgi:tripartite-type tricarboxylate transporter receptor subunit TctC
MRDILRQAAKSPVVAEALAKGSMDPFDVAGDEISAVIRREIAVAQKVVRAANLSPAK